MQRKILGLALLAMGLCVLAGCPDNRGKSIKPDKFEPVPEKGPIGDGTGGGDQAPPPGAPK